MARPEGVEPPTLGSEVQYSIQLSYGRTLSLSLLESTFGKTAHVIPVHLKTRQLPAGCHTF